MIRYLASGAKYRQALIVLMHSGLALTFFFMPWWFRPRWLPASPYFAGFFLTIPLCLSLVAWVLLGLPGLWPALKTWQVRWLIPFALLVWWGALSTNWAVYPGYASDAACQLVAVGVTALFIICAAPSARQICIALFCGLVFQSAVVLYQFHEQRSIGLLSLGEYAMTPNRQGISVVMAGTVRLLRPYGMSSHPNILGGFLAAALIIPCVWLLWPRRLWMAGLATAVTVLGFWALGVTFSRSAWLAFACGCLVLGGIGLRRRQMGRQQVTLIAAMVLTAGVFGATYRNFLLARSGITDQSIEARSISDRGWYYKIALDLLGEYPISGIGLANFVPVSGRMLAGMPGIDLGGGNVHSVPLQVAADLGIVGLGLYLASIAMAFWRAFRRASNAYSLALALSALVLLIAGLFDHYPWTIFGDALLFWGCLAAATLNQQGNRQPADVPTHGVAAGEASADAAGAGTVA